jgi:hypothetical protein
MLDGKIEGAIPAMAVMEEMDGCIIFNQNIDFEENECEELNIIINDGVVKVCLAGIMIEVPREHAFIDLQ